MERRLNGLCSGTEKHRHCGVLTSGVQNLTTAGSVATLQFHSDDSDVSDDDDDADDVTSLMPQQQQRRQRDRNYKGFWLRFEGLIDSKNPFGFSLWV